MKVDIITIAGSDPLSKSGIMADLRVGYDLNSNILNVITAINAQNDQKIRNILYLDQTIIIDQLEAIFSANSQIDFVKIGMVGDKNSINAIVSFFQNKPNIKIIFDPVIKASNGYNLILEDDIIEIIKKLIPICYLVTPNIDELKRLSNEKIQNIADIKIAILQLKKIGAKNILVKGGHFQEKSDKVLSFLFSENKINIFKNKRLNKNCRGTGCMLSTAIAIFLSQGNDLVTSVRKANKYVYHYIKNE